MDKRWLPLPRDVQHILTKASETSGRHVVTAYDNLLCQELAIYERWVSGLKTAEALGKITKDESMRAQVALRLVLGAGILEVPV